MIKKSMIWGVLLLAAASLSAGEIPDSAVPGDGYALLDMYVAAFQQMAVSGSGGRALVETKMNEIIAEAKKLRSQNGIDAVFFARFSRFMAINNLLLVSDPEKALSPVIEPEIARFVRETLGEDYKPGSIGQVASALAEGIIDLHIYLDTKDDRKKMMEDFVNKFPAPKKSGD